MRALGWLGLALLGCQEKATPLPAAGTAPGTPGVPVPGMSAGAAAPAAPSPERAPLPGASAEGVASSPGAGSAPAPGAGTGSAAGAGGAAGIAAAPGSALPPGVACGGVVRRCSADGLAVEQCAADGRFELAHPCRGPGRCRSEGPTLHCDMSAARIDDPCTLEMEGNLACSDDRTMVLACQGRRFAIDELCPSARPCVSDAARFGCGGQ